MGKWRELESSSSQVAEHTAQMQNQRHAETLQDGSLAL
jgi:hypothetical protein